MFIWSSPVIFHWNSGNSVSIGSSQEGALKNPYKMDLYGKNFTYFSYLSYFGLGMCFTNSKVYQTIKDCMKSLETKSAGTVFYVMELSRKNGAKTLLHQTHRSGLSVDLMVPKKNKSGKQSRFYDRVGLWHYLYEFDSEGHLSIDKSVSIDFDALASLITELNLAANKNGLKIKQVIIRNEIKDNLLEKSSVKNMPSYLVHSYPNNKFVNKMHDDHIHVDFSY
jgi:hypothetical protein